MLRRALPLVVLLASVVACSGSSGSGGASSVPGSTITVTASTTKVLANGTNSVLVHFAGAARAPVIVQTSRGAIGGKTTVSIDATSGDVPVVTCNVSADPSCAGTATITATDASLNSGRASITFAGLDACSGDCAFDPGCASAACKVASGAQGTCSGTPAACVLPVCTPTETPAETSCADGLDNDCNGFIDCADHGCDGRPCKAGAAGWVCKSGACADASSGYALQISPARTRMPPNGTATTAVTVKVLSGQNPAANADLTLSATGGTLSAGAARTGSDGTATVLFTAGTASGVATITATMTAVPVVSLSAGVILPALGSITLGSVTYNVMGVKGSGYRETNPIVVSILDDQGKPYPDGLAVRFEHVQLGNSLLSTPAAGDSATCIAAQGCVAFVATTQSPSDKPDTTGLATVNLTSGALAGTLQVVASSTIAGQTRTFNVPNVAVIGAKANGSNFSIVCSPRNVPALAETDCHTSAVDAQFTCVALLEDRFGNPLGTPTQVTFAAEAGAVGQPATTPAYDPGKDPTAQPDLGTAVEIFRTLGAGLPVDVPPEGNEPFVMYADNCSLNGAAYAHNPRDGAVTVIAIADGEEAFFDSNGNGVYDPGEPFVDLGEPFVDANDNGIWDPGEWFLDTNGNGRYDGPNGVWDPNSKIWTQTVVVYTGTPLPAVRAPNTAQVLGTRWFRPGASTGACSPSDPAPTFAVTAGDPPGSDYLSVVAADVNLNRLASAATYGVSVEAPGKVTVAYHGLDQYADDLGFFFRYWPCDKSGNCAYQCPGSGSNLPCVMRPAISSYSCGLTADVTVTGSAQPDGIDLVDWNVTLDYPLYKQGKKVLYRIPIAGTDQ